METKRLNFSATRAPGAILLISCYALGHRPIGLTRPLRAFKAAGFAPDVTDIAVESLDIEKIERAHFIGISVPMHTALRLGIALLHRIRHIRPNVPICMYGLYAILNADYLYSQGVDFCISGEPPTHIVELVKSLMAPEYTEAQEPPLPAISEKFKAAKTDFPDGKLPPLEAYAQFEDGKEIRTVGYTETTHGCKHLCTHCPIPPVYNGTFSVVQRDTVLAEIREHVAHGAMHITFGDPDFLNGPTHGLRILRAMHTHFPHLTFDFTTKITHILQQRRHFPEFADLGCRFVISAVEALNETVLTILEKQHTRADVETAIDIVHSTGIALRPTWVPFTPWTTLTDYLEIFQFIDAHRLIYHVDPVQYAVRLLIPPGSYLLNHPALEALTLTLDEAAFNYTWAHPDPRMDKLHNTVTTLVENDARTGIESPETFYRIWSLAAALQGQPPPLKPDRAAHPPAPRLTESWFC